nr:retrotransposon protein, putative, unclassified [Ipomoea batatas]
MASGDGAIDDGVDAMSRKTREEVRSRWESEKVGRNGEDEDDAGSVGGGTTSAKEVETRGDVIGDGGGTEDVAEDAWREGDAIGDVEDDDGTRGRAIGTCGTGGGHKCRHLFMLWTLEEGEEPPALADYTNDSPTFSLNAISGVTKRNMMKVRVKIAGTFIVALLDSGSSDNFINVETTSSSC